MRTTSQRQLRLATAATLGLAVLSAGTALGQIGVQVNGTPVRFGAVEPMRVGGRVMIPLRSVGEALGAELEWHAPTRSVRGAKDGKTFELAVGSRIASVGGRSVTLDVPATMERGTVLVPLRFVAEALGAEVEWRPADQQVMVATAGGSPREPVAEAGAVVGEIVAVDARANPPTVTVRAGGIRQTYPVARDSIVLRGATGAAGVRTEVADLQPGDSARLRVDAESGRVTVIEAQFRPSAEPELRRPDVVAERPQIRSFSHNATGAQRAGSVVELTLMGTPGASASVEIGSVARDVPLREDPARPGRYLGRFTVPAGITAQDVPIIARLERGGQRAPLVQAGNALNVDSQPPRFTGAAPAGEARIANQRPNIYVNLDDQGGSGIDPRSFRMLVRGRDVTSDAKVTPTFAIYTPEALPEGPVDVEVEVRDEAGNLARTAWSFTIAPSQSLIRSVTHNAEGPLRAGDVLTVRLTGQPGGKAAFDLGEIARGIAMTEESPGNYVGTYTVRRGDQDLKAAVTAHLQAGAQRAMQTTTAPIAVMTEALTAPRITQPKPGEAVPERFIVTGEAPPGSKVLVEVTYTGRALGLLPVQGSAATQEVTTDARGMFETKAFELQLPLGLSRAELQVRAATIDPAGRRSDATAVPLKLR